MTGTPNAELGFTAQAMLCDSAAAVEGKLYIQGGGWNAIAAAAMPFAAPRIGMALLIGVPYGDTERRHQLTVGLEDEDGSQLPLGPVTEAGRTTHLQLAFEVGRPALLPPGTPNCCRSRSTSTVTRSPGPAATPSSSRSTSGSSPGCVSGFICGPSSCLTHRAPEQIPGQ
ncbi:MAG: hypothetical protein WKF47_19350 [Geodermatophilaceae bacterium]